MPLRERYARQVRHWGEQKQQQLQQTSVLVAGLGGLGGAVSQLLVRAGVKKIYLLDSGRVDWPDLNRQLLYAEADIGKPKLDIAARRLGQINSSVAIEPLSGRIAAGFRPPQAIDMVADCLDNYADRLLLEQSLAPGTHLVHGAVEGDRGQVLTLRKGFSQPLVELFSGVCQPPGEIPVTGAAAAVIAALMADELCRTALGSPNLLDRFLIVCLSDLHFSFLDVNP